MKLVPLTEAENESELGGKAVQLGSALRAGLPVPPGFVLSFAVAQAAAAGDVAAIDAVGRARETLAEAIAVRSSAVGEDAAGTSFAGQHLSVLEVGGKDATVRAISDVVRSGESPAALAYRQKLGIAGPPRMGVVLQSMVSSDVAGVLFTRNPVTGAEERVIEASWGLGEAVVAGLVTPDSYRLSAGGVVLERRAGEKDLAVRRAADGGAEEVPVQEHLVHALCLSDAHLARLHALALACERVYAGDHDLEWAFVGEALFLLQRRPITRRAPT